MTVQEAESESGGVTQRDGGEWGCTLSEVHMSTLFRAFNQVQVVAAAPGHQMVNLPYKDGHIWEREVNLKGLMD